VVEARSLSSCNWHGQGHCHGDRDGNGDPIPDSPRGIPLLGDGDGEISSPTGM
jgi:hypothetical protein